MSATVKVQAHTAIFGVNLRLYQPRRQYLDSTAAGSVVVNGWAPTAKDSEVEQKHDVAFLKSEFNM